MSNKEQCATRGGVTPGSSACSRAPLALAARDRGCPADERLGKRQLDRVRPLPWDRPPRSTVPGPTVASLPAASAAPPRTRLGRSHALHRARDMCELHTARPKPARTSKRSEPAAKAPELVVVSAAVLHDHSSIRNRRGRGRAPRAQQASGLSRAMHRAMCTAAGSRGRRGRGQCWLQCRG